MGRNRKDKADRWMPDRVYRGRSKYEWHPKGGGSISLCPLDATEAEVWEAYRDAQASKVLTVKGLKTLYFTSKHFLSRAPKTQKSYEECWKAIEGVFGAMDCTKVKPRHIREYMDTRGLHAEVSANRERALMNNIFGYGFERGLVDANPCVGVRPFKEIGRSKVYVEDADYYSFLEDSEPLVQVFMELSYLLGARGQDVRKILMSDLREEGIYIKQQKTGKKQLKRWNPRLHEAVTLAKRIRSDRIGPLGHDSIYLIVTSRGGAYSERGLISLWARNKQRVLEARKERNCGKADPITWTYHDIKAKSISDYEGDKQAFSGHKSRSMMERYNRSPDVVDALNKPGNVLNIRKKY